MIRIAIASLALSTLAAAQVQVFGGTDNERKAYTKFAFEQDADGGFKMLAGACIQYSAPNWKPEYDAMADKAKGQSFRLGKNFWTTLNTSRPLAIGGTTVPGGSYYLALHCDDKGEFQLLVLDAKNADAQGWSPMGASAWKADYTCPLKHTKGSAMVEQLAITLDGDEPDGLELKIAWGSHELTAPVQMQIAGAKGDKPSKSEGGHHEAGHGKGTTPDAKKGK